MTAIAGAVTVGVALGCRLCGKADPCIRGAPILAYHGVTANRPR